MATTATEQGLTNGVDHMTYRITIDRYLRMVKARIFTEKDPVFLWRGRLVEKMTKGREHSKAVTKLYKKLIGLVPDGWYVEQEQPMEIPDDGVPEPDISVIRGAVDDYPDRAPSSKDVALVVEAADSSISADSGVVLETYASEAIPVYWILNVPSRWIEVHVRPSGPAEFPSYRERRIYRLDDEVPVILDGREVGRISVREIFP
jgi:Uma2 family endonuclease